MVSKSLYILILSFFLPAELSFFVGDVRLEIYRVVLLLLSPYAFLFFFRRSWSGIDYSLLSFTVFVLISVLFNKGLAGVQEVGIQILEVFVVFLLGYAAIARNGYEEFKKYITLFLVLYLILAPFAVYEALTGHRILHDIAASLSGVQTIVYMSPDDMRLGLYRAMSIFATPIFYSMVSAFLFFLTWNIYSGGKRAFFLLGLLVAIVCAVTSVGFLMIFMQLAILITMGRLFRSELLRNISIISAVVLLFVIEITSDGGVGKWIALNLALNEWNGYIRYLQWVYAYDDILRKPFLGPGDWTRPYWMPSSIDAYWLVLAVKYGIPSALSALTLWVLILKYLINIYSSNNKPIFYVLICSVFALLLGCFTVHLFDKAAVIVYLILGFMVGLAYFEEGRGGSNEYTILGS